MLDLSGVLAPKEGRDIEVITREILDAKRRGGEAILTIVRCLTEAKQALPHGEWLPWLNERVELSERAAQRFMRLSREWSNPTALSDLGATKALALLALPADERDQFIETHNVVDMSARQLEQAIKDRDEARKAAETAQAEASAAEQARAKMAEDMALLNARLSGAQEAREAKKRAEDKQKIAEEALEQARLQLEEQAREEKKAALGADKDLAQFEVLFDQTKETVNRMHGILLKVRSRDEDAAGRLSKALAALAEAVRRCAE